jgi:hypothetical protein
VLEYKENVKFYHLTKKLQDKELTIHSNKFFTQVVSLYLTIYFTCTPYSFIESRTKSGNRQREVLQMQESPFYLR